MILTIRNLGTGQLNWQISLPELKWLKVMPKSGIATNSGSSVVKLSISRLGLEAKKYQYSITISSDGGDWLVEVSMLVDRPKLFSNNQHLLFLPKIYQQNFQLYCQGFIGVDFKIQSSHRWLAVNPNKGELLTDQPVTV